MAGKKQKGTAKQKQGPAKKLKDPDPQPEPEPEAVPQPTLRRRSARLAALAPAAPIWPPLPLDIEDPVLLRQLKDLREGFASPNCLTVYNQLQRCLVRKRQLRHPMLMPVFENPSNQALLAKLQKLQLGSPQQGSSKAAAQPAASEPGPSTPPPAKRSNRNKAEPAAEPTQPTKGKGKAQGKAAKAKPAPQPRSALGRAGGAHWSCACGQTALPAKGKEYPGLGYQRVRDQPPKAQQQQRPAEAL
ncbi:hypothetical protein QJQ45_006463 [Haematococcus lacustris]|nr:hypothetical protein QJQ45_006463 [Haematococcus lacustris]